MAQHPLDPLTPEEIAAVVAGIKAVAPSARFVFMALAEHNKAEVIEWAEKKRATEDVSRFAVATTLEGGKTMEYVYDVKNARILHREHRVGYQAGVTGDEYEASEKMLKSHPQLHKALAIRGITNMDLVMIDLWTVGYLDENDKPNRRLGRPFVFYKVNPEANGYGIPVEGISPLIDLDSMELIKIDDTSPTLPLPPYSGDYAKAWRTDPPKYITALQKFQVTQPDGPSYTLDGNVVSWLDWQFHVGFNHREGLTLNLVTFQGRPVLFRMSLAEMIVPYSYPKPPHNRKNAFDVGEEGIGNNAKTLRSGCDCIGFASFLSASLCSSGGEVVSLPDVVCIHEEDSGILWKHTDWRNNSTEVRRSRTLVVSSWATVANYDYSFNYRFFMDGSIEIFSELTGILSTVVLPPSVSSDKYGQVVAQRISATYHQHFFNFRLDPAIDGWSSGNSVLECDSEMAEPGPGNPLKNLFNVYYTPISTENQSGRVQDQTKFRHWVIVNPNKKTELGIHPAYAIMPYAEGTLPFHEPDSFLLKRAPFLSKSLWVTAFSDAEKYPAGKLPNQQENERHGMMEWISRNRVLLNTDVVLWYTMGVHHIPRPEEWPIMPVMKAGWRFIPYGFNNKNPCYNAAPQPCTVKAKL